MSDILHEKCLPWNKIVFKNNSSIVPYAIYYYVSTQTLQSRSAANNAYDTNRSGDYNMYIIIQYLNNIIEINAKFE